MSEAVFQHFKGYELFVSRIEKAIARYEKYPAEIEFEFLTPDLQRVAVSLLGERVPYVLSGGYPDALKKKLIIGEIEDISDYLTAVSATFNTKFNTITHRDVTGALYHLQVEMDRFGDLWVDDSNIYLYCDKRMASFVCEDLTQISRCHVEFRELDYLPEQSFRFKELQVTVSSMRLDVLLSRMIRKSRAKAQEMIRSENINVNFQTIEDCDFLCNNGDIVSVRGTGRFVIANTVATTKSGNTVLIIKQFV